MLSITLRQAVGTYQLRLLTSGTIDQLTHRLLKNVRQEYIWTKS